jgi:DNA-binding response OmpR family regulator
MSRARILLVDDDARHNFALAAILRGAGYDVICCEDAKSALSAVEAGCEYVLTDYQMPEMNGAQFIRAARDHAPVMMAITGCDSPEVRDELLAAGATQVFPKPTEPAVLLAGIRQCCPATLSA